VLTTDLDEKAAMNGSFELNGSAAGGFGFMLLNGSGTRYKVYCNHTEVQNYVIYKINTERFNQYVQLWNEL
jgi:hypothetical protein